MKRLSILFILAICLLKSYCQDKAALTKEETVNYISKKIKESIGFKTDRGEYVRANYITMDKDGKVIMNVENSKDKNYKNYTDCNYSFIFNPVYISDVTLVKNQNEVHILKLKLSASTAKLHRKEGEEVQEWVQRDRTSSGTEWVYKKRVDETITVDYVHVYFLGSDTTNFNKLKKAFEHLRDLCKAEDDPFGN